MSREYGQFCGLARAMEVVGGRWTLLVARRLLARGFAYEVTPYGRDLEEAMVQLGKWGSRMMTARHDDEFFSVHSLRLALRGAFKPAEASDLDHVFELRINGDELRVSVTGRAASFPAGSTGDADTVIETGPDGVYQLLTGGLGVEDALATQLVSIAGDPDSARRFFEVFRLPVPVETEPP